MFVAGYCSQETFNKVHREKRQRTFIQKSHFRKILNLSHFIIQPILNLKPWFIKMLKWHLLNGIACYALSYFFIFDFCRCSSFCVCKRLGHTEQQCFIYCMGIYFMYLKGIRNKKFYRLISKRLQNNIQNYKPLTEFSQLLFCEIS